MDSSSSARSLSNIFRGDKMTTDIVTVSWFIGGLFAINMITICSFICMSLTKAENK